MPMSSMACRARKPPTHGRLLLLAVLLGLAFLPNAMAADQFCKREAYDAEFPAGLTGNYEIVGKDPETGAAYSGHLVIADGKSRYALTRTAGGVSIPGDAWMETCSADKIQFLVVRYYTRPTTQVSCRLGMDGDNYYRATCRTRASDGRWRGLEAWFQSPTP